MKERVDANFDFGFTTVTHEDIIGEEIKNATQLSEEKAKELFKLLKEMYERINPLLNNLLIDAEKKPIIHWPNRKPKIDAFRMGLNQIIKQAEEIIDG